MAPILSFRSRESARGHRRSRGWAAGQAVRSEAAGGRRPLFFRTFQSPLAAVFAALVAGSLWTAAAADLRYQTNRLAGWLVLVDQRLLEAEAEATRKALGLLQGQLEEIVRVIPEPALSRLREVTLWFSPPYPGVPPRAEYHPDVGWLRSNQRNPAMARCVEFTDVANFESESRRMPNFTLHELAHAYHHRVLADGFGNAEIKQAFERALASGRYDHVERKDAEGRVRSERAYALSDPMEYFAETTEAYFSRNDFYPFDRDQLRQADPEMETLLGRLWGTTARISP